MIHQWHALPLADSGQRPSMGFGRVESRAFRGSRAPGAWTVRCSRLVVHGLLAVLGVAPLKAEEPPQRRFPVPVRAWFQPQFLDSRPEIYVGMNMITSLVDAERAERWSDKGVVALRWAFGPQSEFSAGRSSYYRDQCDPSVDGKRYRFAGVGIDEWNPGSPRHRRESLLAAEGYRAARARWPGNLVVAWVTTPDDLFLTLLRDGTFDLAIIEGYTFIPDVGGLDLDGIRARCRVIEAAGLSDRCIVCYGYVAAGHDASGRRMTIEALSECARTIRREFPKMPGLAYYGHADGDAGTVEITAQAEELALELFPAK